MRIAEYNPNIGLIYRDATTEEIADFETQQIEIEPTIEEQLADLTELVGVLTEVICND